MQEEEASKYPEHGAFADPFMVHCEDLALVLNEWRVRWEKAHPPIHPHIWDNNDKDKMREFGAIGHLSFESGLSARRINQILAVRQVYVTFRVAERLLMAIDRDYMLQTGEVPIIPNPYWSNERWLDWRAQEGGACDTP